MDFFTCFTREKTPQNNFSRHFSVERLLAGSTQQSKPEGNPSGQFFSPQINPSWQWVSLSQSPSFSPHWNLGVQHFPCPFSALQGVDVQQSLFGGKPNEVAQLLTPHRRPDSQP